MSVHSVMIAIQRNSIFDRPFLESQNSPTDYKCNLHAMDE